MKVKRYVSFYILLPIVLEFLIEALSRKSLIAAVKYAINSPLLFAFNTLIIMLTLSIAMFFKREVFALTTISVVWVIFGIVNFVILHFRVTPFSAVDFTLIKSAISVSSHYLNLFTIAMIIVAIFVVLIGLICLFRKAPVNEQHGYRKIIFSILCCLTLGVAIIVLHRSSNSVQALSTHYTNISEAYENYGFAYCFANSILDTGIKKPEDYSKQSVKKITKALKDEKNTDKRPNIIFIQLESFFDVGYEKNLQFSEDPLPVFHSLQKKYSSGLVTVPTVGAGTVNTEFEILTGMRQHDFGVSEYPYKTVLKSKTSESICTDLKKLGYSTHAVHNNEATFYGRNTVFSNIGFDTFCSMEYMNGLTDSPNGWSNDDVLSREIMKTLDSTSGPDFTMAITVQSHGKYDGIALDDPTIKVTGAPERKEQAYEYYVNEIHEVDRMIDTLIKELSNRKEETVLVLYGDHLPSLDIQKDDLSNANLYQTQYVVWDNMNLLYGDNYAYDGENPFKQTELQMGTEPVKLTSVQKTKSGYRVVGSGFTPYCKVYYDGTLVESEWISSGCLQLQDEFELDEADKKDSGEPETEVTEPRDVPNAFVVEVQSDDGVVLSSTQAYPASQVKK